MPPITSYDTYPAHGKFSLTTLKYIAALIMLIALVFVFTPVPAHSPSTVQTSFPAATLSVEVLLPDVTIDLHDGQPFVQEYLSSDQLPKPELVTFPFKSGSVVLALTLSLFYWFAWRLLWLVTLFVHWVLASLWWAVFARHSDIVTLNGHISETKWKLARNWSRRSSLLLGIFCVTALAGYLVVFFTIPLDNTSRSEGLSAFQCLWPLLGIPAWLGVWHLIVVAVRHVTLWVRQLRDKNLGRTG